MKPMLLEFEGFGPYVQRQSIDFRTLDRIFLIGGDTGAGKTTLFDAMSYALYGKPLGTRTKEGVRSRFAEPTRSTEVRFRFGAAGRVWEVVRAPHHVRPAQRGGGVVVEDRLTLHEVAADGSMRAVATKPAEINSRLVNDIVHLSHEQFSKVLVLPQGEFQRFLEMNSAERGVLLQQLFPVDEHQAITRAARESVAESRQEAEALRARLEEVQKGFDAAAYPQTRQVRIAAVTEAGATETAAREAEAGARSRLTAAQADAKLRQERDSLLVRRQSLELERPQIVAARAALSEHERSTRVRPHAARLADLEADLVKLGEQAGRLAEAAAKAATEAEGAAVSAGALPERERELRAQEAAAAGLEERGRLLRRRIEAEAAAARALADAAGVEAGVTRARSELQAAEAELARLAEVAQQREAAAPALRAARARVEALRALSRDARLVLEWDTVQEPRLAAAAQAAAQERAAAEAAVRSAEAHLAAARLAREEQAAALLATALEPGHPCPVCGSEEHPRPAHVGAEPGVDVRERIVSAEREVAAAQRAVAALDSAASAREALAAAQQEQAQLSREALQQAGFPSYEAWLAAGQAAAEADRAQNDLDQKLETTLAARPRLVQAVETTRRAFDTATTTLDAARRQATLREGERDALRVECPESGSLAEAAEAVAAEVAGLRQRIEAARAEIGRIRDRAAGTAAASAAAASAVEQNGSRIAERRAEAERARGELTEALTTNGFANRDEAAAAELSSEAERERRTAVGAWERAMAAVEERLPGLVDTLGDSPPADIPALEAEAQAAAAAARTSVEARVTAEAALQELDRAHARHAELLAELSALNARHAGLIQLAKDLEGSNPRRVDFPTYILTWWLGRVLVRANTRLRLLSEGRYAFVLRPGVTDKRSGAGLDVDVFDAHTADRRDVKTLSGGEKFLASLSLALGLADVIQEQAGGVELDTLFIDEGFGSLDANTMDRALEVIDQIGAHRRVGLISHVEAVKKAIPCQLRVVKSAGGSTVVRA